MKVKSLKVRFKNTFYHCLNFLNTSFQKEKFSYYFGNFKWRKKCCQIVDWNWISKDEKKKSTNMVYIFSQLRKGTKTTRQNENVILDVQQI